MGTKPRGEADGGVLGGCVYKLNTKWIFVACLQLCVYSVYVQRVKCARVSVLANLFGIAHGRAGA